MKKLTWDQINNRINKSVSWKEIKRLLKLRKRLEDETDKKFSGVKLCE